MITFLNKKHLANQYLSPFTKPRMSSDDMGQLVAHLLRCPGFFSEAVDLFDYSDWENQLITHKVLIRACLELNENGIIPGDEHYHFKLTHHIQQIIGQSDLVEEAIDAVKEMMTEEGLITQVYQTDVTEYSLDHGRSLLKQFLIEQRVSLPLYLLFHGCRNQLPDDISAIIQKCMERLQSLECIDTKPVKTLGEEWAEHKARLEQFRGQDMVGLRTGMKELDKRTLGLRGLSIFGSKPGAGKTTLSAVQLALGVCRNFADNNAAVIILSLDMDRYDIYRRINSHLADLDWTALMFGSPKRSRIEGSMFSAQHRDSLNRADQRLKDEQYDDRITVLDRSIFTDESSIQQLAAIIKRQKEKAKATRALLIIDYFQILPIPDDVAERGDLAADKHRIRLVQKLIETTKTTNNPFGDTALVISEARKPLNNKDIWGDSMSELMGSARLGYAADAVLLYREMSTREIEQYYGVSAKDKEAIERRRETLKEQGIVPVTLILEKGRDGMLRGKWGMEFYYQRSIFRELQPGQHILSYCPTSSPKMAHDDDDQARSPASGSGPNTDRAVPLPPLCVGGKAKPAAGDGTAKRPIEKHSKDTVPARTANQKRTTRQRRASAKPKRKKK